MHRRTHLKRQDFIHTGQISTTPLLYQSNNASAASALITAQPGVDSAILENDAILADSGVNSLLNIDIQTKLRSDLAIGVPSRYFIKPPRWAL